MSTDNNFINTGHQGEHCWISNKSRADSLIWKLFSSQMTWVARCTLSNHYFEKDILCCFLHHSIINTLPQRKQLAYWIFHRLEWHHLNGCVPKLVLQSYRWQILYHPTIVKLPRVRHSWVLNWGSAHSDHWVSCPLVYPSSLHSTTWS